MTMAEGFRIVHCKIQFARRDHCLANCLDHIRSHSSSADSLINSLIFPALYITATLSLPEVLLETDSSSTICCRNVPKARAKIPISAPKEAIILRIELSILPT